jgi:PhnB protein
MTSATMTSAKVKPIPDGMHSVTPHLVCAGAADAIAFYEKAFGAVETVRMPDPQGKIMHAAVRIGDSTIMLADEFPDFGSFGPKALKGSPVVIHLYVDNADEFAARAVAAGARMTMPVSEMFWGDRYGQLEDPFGHRWSVATHVREVSPEEMRQAMQNMGRSSDNCAADRSQPQR